MSRLAATRHMACAAAIVGGLVGGALASAAAPASAATSCPSSAPPKGATVPGTKVGFAQAWTPTGTRTAKVERDFGLIADTGAKWVRFDVPWFQVQPRGPSQWKWGAVDAAVAAANDRDLEVLLTLAYTPPWARVHAATDQLFPPAPAHVDDFATFAANVVERYSPQGVHAYEIWNEPNLGSFWKPTPDPEAYTALLVAASDAIHEVDPSVTVVSAGLGPAGEPDALQGKYNQIGVRAFLEAMYDAGARGYFDALGHHPYTIPGGPTVTDSWAAFCQTALLHDTMVEHGDGDKAIWATEAGAYTGPSRKERFYHPVDRATQAEYLRQYVTLWSRWPFPTGPMFLYTLWDPPDSQRFGVLEADYDEKPAYDVLSDTIT